MIAGKYEETTCYAVDEEMAVNRPRMQQQWGGEYEEEARYGHLPRRSALRSMHAAMVGRREDEGRTRDAAPPLDSAPCS